MFGNVNSRVWREFRSPAITSQLPPTVRPGSRRACASESYASHQGWSALYNADQSPPHAQVFAPAP